MKYVRLLVLVLIFGLVAIQFVPTSLNQSSVTPKEDILKFYKAPSEVSLLMKNSCYDCHSNNTKYPWYNKIQPVSWIMEGHVKDGKEELNFNEFASYSKRRQKSKLKSIISQIEDDEMPLKGYLLMHGNASLSERDKEIINTWVENLKDSL